MLHPSWYGKCTHTSTR